MSKLEFPKTLTHEEIVLREKYAILREKKKALREMKLKTGKPELNPLKRNLDPKDARAHAANLIQAGKITLSRKPAMQKTVFKRAKVLEKKLAPASTSELPLQQPHFEPFKSKIEEKDQGDSNSDDSESSGSKSEMQNQNWNRNYFF